ncbi:hypothetical protein ACJQWK_10251 [Exserohilum turcicum]|uniref:Apple domain-containing protein n=1 Tax=Exserohilum turcicum (strain 28A) TaxID=671987 RepID=R0K2L6_EXST2|nr:uncharacterized protein SETTUDRAFT_31652 [Exserohilum turcica Et28A]EOA87383.1 hypothetical protein SETTUDRAFT_31652 [Exserohilum turcica Et28A]
MKSILALPAILGAVSAAAVPRAQSPCVSNGRSTAPEPAVNTLAGFNESANYSMLARNAVKPEGYELIMSDTKCALSSSKYMRYSRMSSYDSQTCAKMCDSHPGCDTFNIYVERYPSVVPDESCPNPSAIFFAICALYSEPITSAACDNPGQFIGPQDASGNPFRTAIRASNAYRRLRVKEVIVTVTTTRNILTDPERLKVYVHTGSAKHHANATTSSVAKVTPSIPIKDTAPMMAMHGPLRIYTVTEAEITSRQSLDDTVPMMAIHGPLQISTLEPKITPCPTVDDTAAMMGKHGPLHISTVTEDDTEDDIDEGSSAWVSSFYSMMRELHPEVSIRPVSSTRGWNGRLWMRNAHTEPTPMPRQLSETITYV